MSSQAPPGLLELASRSLLRDAALAITALQELPAELFLRLFMAAFTGDTELETVSAGFMEACSSGLLEYSVWICNLCILIDGARGSQSHDQEVKQRKDLLQLCWKKLNIFGI